MTKKLSCQVIGLAVTLAFVLGVVLVGKRPDLTQAERERARVQTEALRESLELDNQHKATMQKWKAVGKVTLGATAVGVIIGTVLVVWVWGMRRAMTIGPNERGIFPLLLGRTGGSWVVYDANRSPTAATSLGTGGARVRHHLPAGMEAAQARITSQAQSVQALAAVASGEQGRDKGNELVTGVIGAAHQLAKPLPQVERSPWESSHIERLLIEAGELEANDYD